MKLYTAGDLGLSAADRAEAGIGRRVPVGQKIGVFIFYTEAERAAFLSGEPAPKPERLFTPRQGAAYLRVKEHIIYSLIKSNALTPAATITTKTRLPMFILTKGQLERLRKKAQSMGKGRAGRRVADEIDRYITKRNGRYLINGTIGLDGEPLGFKHLRQAREKARTAKHGSPKYKVGERVIFRMVAGAPLRVGVIEKAVGRIDQAAYILHEGNLSLISTRLIRRKARG